MTTAPWTSADREAVVERARSAAAEATPDFGRFFLARFLDLSISYDDEARECTVLLPFAAHLTNPQGSVHGGVLATAMDVSMGHLCHRFLSTAVTLEMQVRFFRPLTGDGRCTGRLLRAGRRIVHLESRLTDESQRPVAAATATWHRLDPVADATG